MGVAKFAAASVLAFAGWVASVLAHAGEVECKMNFRLAGWSVFYQTATGSGTVHCSNGQSMSVHIRVKGGGLTFGKNQIDDGVGKFSGISGIGDIKGHYADAGVDAGASKSAGARVMTKGNVSLALSGTGKGWDLGVAFGAFIIE
ncbi:hypothetical protein [Dyella telluris]|uniref:Secreted protein n=1 Tax=Dyella telluris TaxID=2763498 RepID=A0A7G8Q7Q7_9GAMM|nr:hypothetical protein [Dyella telluris]QNK02815.1 hypothetical protein H8F01_06750 [Dyella telluris]